MIWGQVARTASDVPTHTWPARGEGGAPITFGLTHLPAVACRLINTDSWVGRCISKAAHKSHARHVFGVQQHDVIQIIIAIGAT